MLTLRLRPLRVRPQARILLPQQMSLAMPETQVMSLLTLILRSRPEPLSSHLPATRPLKISRARYITWRVRPRIYHIVAGYPRLLLWGWLHP